MNRDTRTVAGNPPAEAALRGELELLVEFVAEALDEQFSDLYSRVLKAARSIPDAPLKDFLDDDDIEQVVLRMAGILTAMGLGNCDMDGVPSVPVEALRELSTQYWHKDATAGDALCFIDSLIHEAERREDK